VIAFRPASALGPGRVRRRLLVAPRGLSGSFGGMSDNGPFSGHGNCRTESLLRDGFLDNLIFGRPPIDPDSHTKDSPFIRLRILPCLPTSLAPRVNPDDDDECDLLR